MSAPWTDRWDAPRPSQVSEVEDLKHRLRVAEFNAEGWESRHHHLMALLLRANRRSEARSRWDAAQLLKSVATHTMTKTDRRAWESVIQWLWRDDWGTLAERFAEEADPP